MSDPAEIKRESNPLKRLLKIGWLTAALMAVAAILWVVLTLAG